MKTTNLTLTALLLLVVSLFANDQAIDVSKAHLNAVLQVDGKKLEETYASRVVLVPGHEFLKVHYGFTTEPGRNHAADVERAKLIQAMIKAAEGQPARPAEKIAAMMQTFQFAVIKTTPGDFVDVPDSKQHFAIKEGDVLIKASPPKGDFVLLQLRLIDGTWRVIAEYLD